MGRLQVVANFFGINCQQHLVFMDQLKGGMMEKLTFQELAELINFSKITEINPDPIKTDKGKWAIYFGTNNVPPFKYSFYILYLYADATIDSIEKAVYELDHPDKTHIVYANSLAKKFAGKDIKGFIKKSVVGISNTKEYLMLFIKDKLDKYLHEFSRIPSFYIEPSFDTPSGAARKIPNPLLSFLTTDTDSGSLAVLVAEPGQGKTYNTEYIAAKLCARGVIPIYIKSEQWVDLSVSDLSSLWKTIVHSFKYYDSKIDWVDGCEKEFVDATLKAGIFSIVFDGFDEYILWNKGNIDPVDAIASIANLAKISTTNIIVTTRTSFWNSVLKGSEYLKEDDSIYVYELKPFDRNQAMNYFSSRFEPGSKKCQYCLTIYDAARKQFHGEREGDFLGRGFVLNLIADLVDRADTFSDLSVISGAALPWIMRSLCEREEVRQKLPLNSNEQLAICRELAENIACKHEGTTETLRAIIKVCKETLSEKEISLLVDESANMGSLKDHPLIRRQKEEWNFVHEQIYFNLLAEQIIEYALSHSRGLVYLIENISEKGSLIDDICNSIVDQVFLSGSIEKSINKTKVIIEELAKLTCKDFAKEENCSKAKKMATSLALVALEYISDGDDKKERTRKFVSILPWEQLKDLNFDRQISRMNFSGYTFRNCRFSQSTFANCEFDEQTIFDSCTFVGGAINYCRNFGISKFMNLTADKAAERIIEACKVNDGSKAYTKENLRNDMTEFLYKFTEKGKSRVKTLHESNINTGVFGKSPYKSDIIKEFLKDIIEPHHISGSSDPAYHIRAEAISSFQHFLSNGVFTGSLARAHDALVSKLKL